MDILIGIGVYFVAALVAALILGRAIKGPETKGPNEE